ESEVLLGVRATGCPKHSLTQPQPSNFLMKPGPQCQAPSGNLVATYWRADAISDRQLSNWSGALMHSSMFNIRVPLSARDDVFLMNTLTDAQLVVSADVAALLDRVSETTLDSLDAEEQEAVDLLWENGFLVESHAADRRNLDQYLAEVKSDTAELNVTLLTTLQCNFACDY